jgi:WD40 repeat protein
MIILKIKKKVWIGLSTGAVNLYALGAGGLFSGGSVSYHTTNINPMTQINVDQVATGCDDYLINVVDIKSGALLKTLSGHTSSVMGLVVLPNGLLASGAQDSTIKLWNMTTGTLNISVTAPAQVMHMRWHEGISKLAVSMQTSKFVFFNPNHQTFATPFTTARTLYSDIDIIPSSGNIMMVSNIYLDVYNSSGTQAYTYTAAWTKKFNRVKMAPDNVTAILAYQVGYLQTFQTSTNALGSLISCHSSSYINVIKFTPDNLYLLSVAGDNKIWMWTWTATTLTNVAQFSIAANMQSGLILNPATTFTSGILSRQFHSFLQFLHSIIFLNNKNTPKTGYAAPLVPSPPTYTCKLT